MRISICAISVILAGMFYPSSPSTMYPMNYSGVSEYNYSGAPTACWDFDIAVGGTYTDDCSGTYTMTVNGSPERVLDGTYPGGIDAGPGGYAWTFDGTTDYLSLADGSGGGDFDGTAAFSVQVVFIAKNEAAYKHIIVKSLWAGQYGWIIRTYNGTVQVLVSDDGSSQTLMDTPQYLSSGQFTLVTFTYQYVSPGSSVGRIHVNEFSETVSTSLLGPIHDSTGPFVIGGWAGPGWNSTVSHVIVWMDRIISHEEHLDMFSHIQGRSACVGDSVRVDVSSASPPAARLVSGDSGVEPYIQQMSSNSWQTTENGFESPDAITNSIYRACFVSGTTGWVETTGGSASIAADTTTKAFGVQSVKFTHTGAGDSSSLDSACKTDRIGNTVYFDVDAKDGGDTSSCAIQILEYDAADCTTLLATNDIVAATDLATDWTHYEGTLAAGTWNGSTSSWRLRLMCADTTGAYTANWGYAQVSEQETWSVCCTDADANAVCNRVVASINDPTSIGGTWEVSFTIRTPWVGDDGIAHELMQLPGTAGNNNLISVSKTAANDFEFSVYTDAGVAKTASHAVNSTNWAADTDHDIVLTHYSDGRVFCEIDGTPCSSSGTGALQDAHSADMYLSGTASASGNHAIKDLVFKRRGTLP